MEKDRDRFTNEDKIALAEFLEEQRKTERTVEINRSLVDWYMQECLSRLKGTGFAEDAKIAQQVFDEIYTRTEITYQQCESIEPFELEVVKNFNLGVVFADVSQRIQSLERRILEIPLGTTQHATVEEGINIWRYRGSLFEAAIPMPIEQQ